MSKKSNNGWGVFWIVFFIIIFLPKAIAGEDKKLEWIIRMILVAICLSPFWIGFIDLILKGKIP